VTDVALGKPADISADTVLHRIGGSAISNLRLSVLDETLNPPGISVLLGGTPQAAANQMRAAFPRSRKWNAAHAVGTSTAAAIRGAGFELVPDPTTRFANHARLIHPAGVVGFTDENLKALAQTFQEMSGC
jgi:hypothetical protein